jgi:hypothetical protein
MMGTHEVIYADGGTRWREKYRGTVSSFLFPSTCNLAEPRARVKFAQLGPDPGNKTITYLRVKAEEHAAWGRQLAFNTSRRSPAKAAGRYGRNVFLLAGLLRHLSGLAVETSS